MKKFKIAMFLMILSLNILGQNLKPGDGIRVNFYNISEQISGDYFIQDNGKIHLPYLGLINSVDCEFNDLRTEIINKYSEIYKNPELSIQPLHRVDILGEVGKPGVYYLTGFETISDLLSLAGGETSDSNIDELSIIRNDSQIEIDLEKFLEGKNNLADIGLESGDKVYVPRKWLVGVRDASVIISGVAVLAAIASLFIR